MGEIFLIGVAVIVFLVLLNEFLDSYEEWSSNDDDEVK